MGRTAPHIAPYGVITDTNGHTDTKHEMRDTALPTDRHDEPTLYVIRIKGHLDDRWAAWFDDLRLTHDGDGTTILRGPVADQAALHGVIKKVRDLALPLISVIRVDRDHPEFPDVDADAWSKHSHTEVDA